MDAQAFIDQQIRNAGGDPDNYYVKITPVNRGASTFVAVTCKYAPWQDNNHPFSPYDSPRNWSRTEAADKFTKYKADREALKVWFKANGASPNWVGKAAAKWRCGNKEGENDMWRTLPGKVIADLKCPDHDSEGATVNWDQYDPNGACFGDGPERDMKGFSTQYKWNANTTTDAIQTCKDYCKIGNFIYAGVQNGVECWCDNSFGTYGNKRQDKKDAKCDIDCNDNTGRKCGGAYANQVYLSGAV